MDQVDLLNQDSFISGLIDTVVFNSIQTIFSLFLLVSLCTGDFGISAVSTPSRKPMPESNFMPIIGKIYQSTPKCAPQPVLAAVSETRECQEG